jgi:glutamyl/glutaminyl-tRNA synthetase
VNGPLHLGHLYVALVNQAEARTQGGRFLLRLDDNQPAWRRKLGAEEVKRLALEQAKTLWDCRIYPDDEIWQSKEEARVRSFLATHPRFHPVFDDYPVVEHSPRWIGSQPMQPFCLTTYITAERVLLDAWEGVTLLIRGHELVGETALYTYFCYLFGLPVPTFVYVPRLRCQDGAELTDISKTTGNWKLVSLLTRWSAQDIIYHLSYACLKEPDQPWLLDNVWDDPRLTDEFYR